MVSILVRCSALTISFECRWARFKRVLAVSGMEGDCRYSAGNQSVANLRTPEVATDRPGGAEEGGKSEGDLEGEAIRGKG